MKAFVAIPSYNCEKQIVRVIAELSEKPIGEIDYVAIWDNDSCDNTTSVALELIKQKKLKNISIFKNQQNYGLGGTFKLMMKYAQQNNIDYLILLHGDAQGSSNDIHKMLQYLNDNLKTEILFGARFMKESQLNNYSKIREIGNRLINRVFSLLTGKKIFEIGSGLNIYKVKSFSLEEIESYPDHIAFDVNLLLNAVKQKKDFSFFPIKWSEDDQVSNANNIIVGLQVLWILFKWKVGLNIKTKIDNELRKYQEIR